MNSTMKPQLILILFLSFLIHIASGQCRGVVGDAALEDDTIVFSTEHDVDRIFSSYGNRPAEVACGPTDATEIEHGAF